MIGFNLYHTSYRVFALSVIVSSRFGVSEFYLGMSDIHFMISLFDSGVGVRSSSRFIGSLLNFYIRVFVILASW